LEELVFYGIVKIEKVLSLEKYRNNTSRVAVTMMEPHIRRQQVK